MRQFECINGHIIDENDIIEKWCKLALIKPICPICYSGVFFKKIIKG